MPEETRRRISEAKKGHFVSEETKRKLSESHKGQIPPNKGKKGLQASWNKGKTGIYSEDALRKMSEAKKGRVPWIKGKGGFKSWNKGLHVRTNTGRTHFKKGDEKLIERRMKQVFPYKDTKPELKLQERLTRMGIPFEKHKPILGQPDIFLSPNICIFVDGCWWHNCPYHRKPPFDQKEIDRNIYVTEKLQERGYLVLRFWEHDINNNLDKVIEKIREFYK